LDERQDARQQQPFATKTALNFTQLMN
jgi:hypothetical protein